MLLNREKRIKNFGFDDKWFTIIGMVVLSLITDYLFNNSFGNHSIGIAITQWSFSLIFSMLNWLTLRRIMIYLRERYTAFEDNFKRIALIFVCMIFTVLAVDMVGNLLISSIFGDDYHPLSRSRILIPILLISTMVTAIYEAIYLYHRLASYIRIEEQEKNIIVQAKLDALSNQAQPHFLFNSLNTLRDIIDEEPKEEAKEFVDKIADVYRFILDTGNANLVPLSRELQFAQAYMYIQSERFGDNLNISWEMSEHTGDMMIVPMSLQLLLENAVKHNVISRAKPLYIKVTSTARELVVQNRIQLKSTQLISTGLGLANIEKRYGLLSERNMEIVDDGDTFSVTIPLLSPSQSH